MIKEKLYSIIRTTLQLPEDFVIYDNLEPIEVPGWDSLGWINIINTLEDHFNVKLPIERLADVQTVGEIVVILSEEFTR